MSSTVELVTSGDVSTLLPAATTHDTFGMDVIGERALFAVCTALRLVFFALAHAGARRKHGKRDYTNQVG